MANQNRRPSGTQTEHKSSKARRAGQATAGSARKSGGSRPRPQNEPRSQNGSRPAQNGSRPAQNGSRPAQNGSRPAAGKPLSGAATAVAPASTVWTPRWLRMVTLALSLIGVGLSIYLTIAHLAGAGILLCSNHGLVDCAAVTTSPESELFGIFPVAELGLAFYVFMTVINMPWAWQPDWRWLPARGPRAAARRRTLALAAWRVRLAAMILGVLFILYLIYTEFITLRTICLWCTYVHITTFVLFVVLVAQAVFWGGPAKAAASRTAGQTVR